MPHRYTAAQMQELLQQATLNVELMAPFVESITPTDVYQKWYKEVYLELDEMRDCAEGKITGPLEYRSIRFAEANAEVNRINRDIHTEYRLN